MERANSIPTVAVLMSTYNGEKYLKEQLESIFDQNDVNVNLYVRDDGSIDKTINILQQYKEIHLIEGKNVGCEASFLELLYMNIEADYYAFADQDDVWMLDKLSTAIHAIREYSSEMAVCNLQLADGELKPLGVLFSDEKIKYYSRRMKNYAICNFHGCVQVWSKKLHKIIQSYRPSIVFPHDVWVNAIANIVSSTYIDPEPRIMYRLHGNNVSGYAMDEFSRIKKGVKFYLGKKRTHFDLMSDSLLEGYGSYLNNCCKKEFLLLSANYKKSLKIRCKLFFHNYFKESSFQHRVLFRIMILTNKY